MSGKIPIVHAGATAQEILRQGAEAAQGIVKLACSFFVEDTVIIDMIHKDGVKIGIFALPAD
ncbi:MAG: hypothetical protein PHD01_10025 [Geobacteraceae bacterium]|nr:hypothetical protein [Geobacteraceae bacterium]